MTATITSRPDVAPRVVADSEIGDGESAGSGHPRADTAGLDRVIAAMIELLHQHPLILPGLATAFVFLKVIRVSRAHSATAMALLSTADATTIALGGLLSLLYTATLLGMICGLCVVGRRQTHLTRHLLAVGAVLLASMTLGFLLLHLPILAVLCLLAVGLRGVDALTRRWPAKSANLGGRLARLGVVSALSSCAAMSLWAFVDETPWVAPERIEIGGGQIVGYVVSSGDWITVLTEETRTIRHLRDDEIVARELCDLDRRSGFRTLPQFLSAETGAGRYPPCR